MSGMSIIISWQSAEPTWVVEGKIEYSRDRNKRSTGHAVKLKNRKRVGFQVLTAVVIKSP
jgi:hypothetical protein